MRKLILMTIIMIICFGSFVEASEVEDNTIIPEMTFEVLMQSMQARQAKVDIIKKNNIEITNLKESLKSRIAEAALKINELKIEVYKDDVVISNETLEELRVLLNFLQESKQTLEEDAEKISSEIESILDLISAKSMQLEQYDLLIEKQNEVIVEMKSILEGIEGSDALVAS